MMEVLGNLEWLSYYYMELSNQHIVHLEHTYQLYFNKTRKKEKKRGYLLQRVIQAVDFVSKNKL